MSLRNLLPAGGTIFAALLLATLAIALEASVPQAARADACANAVERFGASANLPDCRAYELVTPMIKEDNSIFLSIYGFADGEHLIMTSILPIPGANTGESAVSLSSRTASGWVTHSLFPPQGPGTVSSIYSSDQGEATQRVSFTSDFSTAFVTTPFPSGPLDQNLDFDVDRVNIASGAATQVSLPDTGPMTEAIYNPPGVYTNGDPGAIQSGNSADGSRAFFTTVAPIPTAPGTPAVTQNVGNEVYERHADHTYLVGVLPNGSVPSCGAEVGEGGGTGMGQYQEYSYGAVSADGTNVVFRTPAEHYGLPEEHLPSCPQRPQNGITEALYLREDNGTSAAKTVTLSGVVYLGRTADGSKILTTGGGSLYEYDIATGQTTTIGAGLLLASSADGSRVYYMGGGGQFEVYDKGTTKTIVPNAGPGYAGSTLRDFENNFLGVNSLENLPVATPDGSKLIFRDKANLTGYNTASPACAKNNQNSPDAEGIYGGSCGEIYIYDLNTDSVACVSCNPSGTPPSKPSRLFIPPPVNPYVPQSTSSISADGSRAFFETEEALVPQDTNELRDVYEWENGHIYLLSSGQGSTGSALVGVSSDGNDVFIETDDHLLPQDIENSLQIYDARVGGGFPYTTPVYGCDSGQCQGPQTPAPGFGPPASATFVGVGNLVRETGAPLTKPKSKKPKHRTKQKLKKRQGKKGKRGNRKGKGRK